MKRDAAMGGGHPWCASASCALVWGVRAGGPRALATSLGRSVQHPSPWDLAGLRRWPRRRLCGRCRRRAGFTPVVVPPTSPPLSPRDKAQNNVTAPASRIRKNSHSDGLDHSGHAQAAVTQYSFLIGAVPCPTSPPIQPRPSHPGTPSPWPWAHLKLAPWTMGTSAPTTARPWQRVTWAVHRHRTDPHHPAEASPNVHLA